MKKVEVVTLPRTMSGYKGGYRITLDECDAKKWIERKWGRPLTADERKAQQAEADL